MQYRLGVCARHHADQDGGRPTDWRCLNRRQQRDGNASDALKRAAARRRVQNEVIDTADQSASRVVFQDKTELSVGPQSSVVLDRFVFDPDPSKSAVAISIAKGVARFGVRRPPCLVVRDCLKRCRCEPPSASTARRKDASPSSDQCRRRRDFLRSANLDV